MATFSPLGLQQLKVAGEVQVKRRPPKSWTNKYQMVVDNDVIILRPREDPRVSFKDWWNGSIDMELYDTEEDLIFTVRRAQCGVWPIRLGILMHGQLACMIQEERTWFRSELYIKDIAGSNMLRLRYSPHEMKVLTLNKTEIGGISRKVSTSASDGNNKDTRFVRFPKDLDVRCKAAVLGMCIVKTN